MTSETLGKCVIRSQDLVRERVFTGTAKFVHKKSDVVLTPYSYGSHLLNQHCSYDNQGKIVQCMRRMCV